MAFCMQTVEAVSCKSRFCSDSFASYQIMKVSFVSPDHGDSRIIVRCSFNHGSELWILCLGLG